DPIDGRGARAPRLTTRRPVAPWQDGPHVDVGTAGARRRGRAQTRQRAAGRGAGPGGGGRTGVRAGHRGGGGEAGRWVGSLGLGVEELPATRRSDAKDSANAARARQGRFFYLVGGDPGLVPKVLADTRLWNAIVAAWQEGAALAGSSAGAMALGEWTLVRERMPGGDRRRSPPALGLVPRG